MVNVHDVSCVGYVVIHCPLTDFGICSNHGTCIMVVVVVGLCPYLSSEKKVLLKFQLNDSIIPDGL